ncbi:MAG: EFR1 family ferrodoxin [Candidatus Cloacimonetes bacterium]|nr:EFR1 family ferrodoxin [Candidatus Cloacimonadota bacterium]
MKIGIYYFSGTGNTRFIAQEIQLGLSDGGSVCELIPIETITKRERTLEPEKYDLVGIGFPVHAFDAPRIVYDFLEMLPIAHIRCFLFKTAGDKFLNGGSTRRVRMLLAHHNWKLEHESFFVMPSNIASKAKTDKIESLVEAAKIHAAETVCEILSETKRILPDSSAQRMFSLMHHVENRGCKQGSRYWRTNDKCVLCGSCVAECPTKNISIAKGKIVFGDSCILCLRCWWNCPTRAIYHQQLNFVLLKQPYVLPKAKIPPKTDGSMGVKVE